MRTTSPEAEGKRCYRLRNRQLEGYKFCRRHPVVGDYADPQAGVGAEKGAAC